MNEHHKDTPEVALEHASEPAEDFDVSMGTQPFTTDDVGLATDWLGKQEPAVSGKGGRRVTIKVVGTLVGRYGLTPAAALGLLLDTYNQRCTPPWAAKDLEKLVGWCWERRYPGGDAARRAPSSSGATGQAASERVARDADVLNTAYTTILGGMPLSHEVVRGLHGRGLADAQVAHLGYRTWGLGIDGRKALLARVNSALGDEMYAVPGIHRTHFGPELALQPQPASADMLAVPVRDIEGRVVGIRVRIERVELNKKHLPIKDKDGRSKLKKSYIWLSGRDEKEHPEDARVTARCHVPLHGPAMDLSVVGITEGEVKADIATLISGLLYVSVPGVSSWRLGLEQAKALGASKVVLAYDSDADGNWAVADALVRSFEAATEMGTTASIQTWASAVGKGIDDVLAKDGSAVQTLEGDQAAAFVRRLAGKHKLRTKPRDDGAGLAATLQAAESDDVSDATDAPEDAKRDEPSGGDTATPRKSRFHLTDLGNAERMVALFGDDFRYISSWGKFLCWDGTRWAADDAERILFLAQRTALSIYREAASEADTQKRGALVNHARATEATSRLKAMIAQVIALPGVAIKPAALDANPWLLNCLNGTVNLKTGELRTHLREDLITKTTGVRFDPSATCPLWEKFLDRVQPDKHVQQFLGRLAGYALTADVGEHVLPIHHGKGRNGKGVYVNTRLHAMGDYATQIPTELLMMKRGETHPTEKTVLFGTRFAAAVESEEGRSLNVAFVKQATGGDRISARRMREDFWEFEPTHKIELSTNHRPGIKETADAIWERVMLIPWQIQIPKDDRDKTLGTKLRAEAPGILAWAVRHCLAWQREGLGIPASVRVATQKYREAEDLFAMFLDERCVEEAKAASGATELQEAYAAWAEARNERELSHKALSSKLEERGFVKGRDSRTNNVVWSGLRLREGASPAASPTSREDVSEEELEDILRRGSPEGTEDADGDPVYPHTRASKLVHTEIASVSSASSGTHPLAGDVRSWKNGASGRPPIQATARLTGGSDLRVALVDVSARASISTSILRPGHPENDDVHDRGDSASPPECSSQRPSLPGGHTPLEAIRARALWATYDHTRLTIALVPVDEPGGDEPGIFDFRIVSTTAAAREILDLYGWAGAQATDGAFVEFDRDVRVTTRTQRLEDGTAVNVVSSCLQAVPRAS